MGDKKGGNMADCQDDLAIASNHTAIDIKGKLAATQKQKTKWTNAAVITFKKTYKIGETKNARKNLCTV